MTEGGVRRGEQVGLKKIRNRQKISISAPYVDFLHVLCYNYFKIYCEVNQKIR